MKSTQYACSTHVADAWDSDHVLPNHIYRSTNDKTSSSIIQPSHPFPIYHHYIYGATYKKSLELADIQDLS